MIKAHFLKQLLNIDATLRYALGTRIWQALSACITLVMILKLTQPDEQGVYYTLTSLANLQIFFELGLSFVILQSTSHYFKALTWGAQGSVLGPQDHFAILLSFAQKSLHIYAILAGIFVTVMLPFGLFFFNLKTSLSLPGLQISWVLLILGMTLNLLWSPIVALLEGSGKVKEIYRLRLKQLMVANVLAWTVFLLTNSLFLIVVNTWMTAITTVWWLMSTHRQFLLILARTLFKPAAFSWRTEIWPMQWRIAISYVSGYVINQIFMPLLFYYQGAVVSGRMGICLTILNMLGLFAMTWVTVRSPKMGELAAYADHKNLDRVFFTAFWQSVSIFMLGAVGLLILAYGLQGYPIMTRFLPWSEIVLLGLAYLFIHIIGVLALYLRAHRIELFMPLSVIGASLIAVGAWYGAVHYGSLGVSWCILLVNAVYGFPSALWLWLKFKRKWRDQNDANINTSEAYN